MKTQKDLIFGHLVDYRTITPKQAYERYGCMRLAAYILRYRRQGWEIETENITETNAEGRTIRYAKYHLRNI